jgi:2-methylcitrate dehydratase
MSGLDDASPELGGATIADSVVRGFTEFASRLDHADVGETTFHAAKRCLVDAIGCGLAGQATEVVDALRSVASTVTSSRPATLFGTTIRTTPDLAAFVNGSAIRCLDFNDDYFGTDRSNAHGDNGPHPSDNIGAVLAAAEVAGADTTLLGTVIAYEVCGQLVDEVVLRSNGWDYTIFHAIATSAAAGRLLDLTPEQVANAVRLAAVANLSVHETRAGALSHWKGLAGPNGSRNGFFAALLAEAGITGPEKAFEGRQGLMKQIDHTFSLGPFGGPGNAFRIENTYFKHLPLRYELQLPVQVAMGLHGTVDPAQIDRMTVHMERKSVTTRAKEPELWRPTTRETADHSGAYLVAAALVHGGVDEATFTPERFTDPLVLQVMDAIELVAEPAYTATFPWTMSCRFEITLNDGRVLTVHEDNPKGHPRRPMSDDEIDDKFLRQVRPRLGADRAHELLGLLWNLEQETSLKRMFDLMVVPTGDAGPEHD